MAAPVVVDDRVAVAGAGAERRIAVARRPTAIDHDAARLAFPLPQYDHPRRVRGRLPQERDVPAVHARLTPSTLEAQATCACRRRWGRVKAAFLVAAFFVAAFFVDKALGGRSAARVPAAGRGARCGAPNLGCRRRARLVVPEERPRGRAGHEDDDRQCERTRPPASSPHLRLSPRLGAESTGNGRRGRSRGSGSSSRARRESSGSTSASSGLIRPMSAWPTGTAPSGGSWVRSASGPASIATVLQEPRRTGIVLGAVTGTKDAAVSGNSSTFKAGVSRPMM